MNNNPHHHPLLAIANLSKIFSKENNTNSIVLNNISFNTNKGQVVAILGASGSGKSTFLNLIAGLETPNNGKVLFSPRHSPLNLSAMNESQLAKVRNQFMGFIFQSHHLIQELTTLENILLPAFIYNTPKSKKIILFNRAKWLLKQVGLLDRANSFIGELSGGEMQRIAVARALINKPALILADEPTGNLDEKNSMEIFSLLKNLSRSENSTVILVTHFVKLAHLSDVTYEIKNSQIQIIHNKPLITPNSPS